MNLVIFIPGHVKIIQQVYMLIEKQKMRKEILRRKPSWLNVEVWYSCDLWKADAQKRLENAEFDKVFRIIDYATKGIVVPTRIAIMSAFQKYKEDCFLIRIGQDVTIDMTKFFERVKSLKHRSISDKFIMGHNDTDRNFTRRWTNPDVEIPQRYTFIQGNFLLAPIKVWYDYYYHGLPKNIVHYADDSVFSFRVERAKGKLIEIPSFWKHWSRNGGFPQH